MSARCLSLLVALFATVSCAHRQSVCTTTGPAPQPAVQREPSAKAGAAAPTLRDLIWQLKTSEAAEPASAPEGLHSFAVGRWECALGQVEARDVLSEDVLTLQRSRRVACTHASGATVQSELHCSDRTAAIGERAPAPAQQLTLRLDTLPPVQLTCEARAVRELTLRGSEQAAATTLCQAEQGWRACPSSAAQP